MELLKAARAAREQAYVEREMQALRDEIATMKAARQLQEEERQGAPKRRKGAPGDVDDDTAPFYMAAAVGFALISLVMAVPLAWLGSRPSGY